MSIAARVKNAGLVILGLAALVAVLAIGTGLLYGTASLSTWALKWAMPMFYVTLLVSVVLLAPLALVPSTRNFSGAGFEVASFVCGVILWVAGMAYTYSVWGFSAVLLGLFFFGIGVVPLAVIAALLHGDWASLGGFFAVFAAAAVMRGVANWLANKEAERTALL